MTQSNASEQGIDPGRLHHLEEIDVTPAHSAMGRIMVDRLRKALNAGRVVWAELGEADGGWRVFRAVTENGSQLDLEVAPGSDALTWSKDGRSTTWYETNRGTTDLIGLSQLSHEIRSWVARAQMRYDVFLEAEVDQLAIASLS